MNYIYDILLNYNNVAYDFFEWNTSDTILHIRKIPLIKVNVQTLSDIKDYDIKFDTSFLEYIKRKTEIFQHKSIRSLEEACLFSDGTNVVAIMIKNNRCLKSKLVLEEEEEVLSISQRLKEQEVNYKKGRKILDNKYKTRKQIENEQKLRKELKKQFTDKKNETIKYMYYECFNKKEENINIIKREFYSILNDYDESRLEKLRNILKLLEIKH